MEGSPAGSCLPLQARERLPRRAEDSRATGVTAKERRRAGERSVCAGKLSRQRREPELRDRIVEVGRDLYDYRVEPRTWRWQVPLCPAARPFPSDGLFLHLPLSGSRPLFSTSALCTLWLSPSSFSLCLCLRRSSCRPSVRTPFTVSRARFFSGALPPPPPPPSGSTRGFRQQSPGVGFCKIINVTERCSSGIGPGGAPPKRGTPNKEIPGPFHAWVPDTRPSRAVRASLSPAVTFGLGSSTVVSDSSSV
ncbi:uncharacterized protein LOC129211891 [Grus americana]|nr:uncharacterized protein LOC129211890 [Grus americana]XP_054695648.1 uncharacterized protein LOC129211891 [Grus americana]